MFFKTTSTQFIEFKNSPEFVNEFNYLLKHYVGRPTPVYYAKNLSKKYGADIYLKREDLNHTGAHKINHALGQALLAKYLGKNKIIAETGAGQHGVATATAAALMGLECDIYMGESDIAKEKPNVDKMRILGANIVCVTSGQKTLKEAVAVYEKKFGPLTIYGVKCDKNWTWVDEPWPWQEGGC